MSAWLLALGLTAAFVTTSESTAALGAPSGEEQADASTTEQGAPGEEQANDAGAARAWTGSATINGYLLPDEEDFINPVFTARHGRLHLEGRYNYEDRSTGSVFAGWIFETGGAVDVEVTPMLGVLAGGTDGVAPGCTVDVSWRRLSLYSEIEYVIDLSDHAQNFYYSWSELAWQPLDWLSAGIAAQRTHAHEDDIDLESGPFIAFGFGRYSAAGYWFSPGSDDRYGVLSFGVEF